MSKPSVLLCIDAGNTLVKWCVHYDASLPLLAVAQQWSKPTAEFKLDDLPGLVDAVLLSNVLGPEFEASLRAHCDTRKIELHVLKANVNSQLQSAYDNSALLGKDRWAACLAVAQASKAPVNLVVSFGTATTLDALVKKEGAWQHLGGFIVPGVQTMLTSLHNNTAELPKVDFNTLAVGHFEWPRNTQQAIGAGVGRMQIAWVQLLVDELKRTHGQLPVVWFSGGFAAAMQSLYPAAQLLEHAVFKGLVFDYQMQHGGAA
ncbi:type III pantothenate kinase [Limnobacter sp.]|uniref:type III pantothenate kinase n=1 Tax=Limnobacter sp. TaxID=2003368 RepID=UPI002FE0AC86